MSRTKKAARKRKAVDDNEQQTEKPQTTTEEPEKPRERKIKKPRQTGPAQKRLVSHDDSIAKRDPALLADLFAQKVAKHYGDSTVIEQQDIGISKDWVQDTTDFEPSHTAENLSPFLEKFVQGGKRTLSQSTTEGTPNTLVISSSGIRVADVVRELRDFNMATSKVAKFIAKHQKLKENIEYLSKTKAGIVVATPARLKDLLTQEAIKVTDLKAVVLDVSYLDEKQRGLIDMSEVFKPLLDVLSHQSIKERLEQGETKLLVF